MTKINFIFNKLFHKLLNRLKLLRLKNYFKLHNQQNTLQLTIKKLQSELSQLQSELSLQDNEIKSFKNSINKIEKKYQSIEKNQKSIIINSKPADFSLQILKNKYKNQSCFLLGAGKSLDELDPELINDSYIMTVNGAIFKKGLKSNFFCSVSYKWYKNFISELSNVKIEHMFLPHYIYDEVNHDRKVLFNCLEHYRYLDLPVPLYFSQDVEKNIPLGGTVIGVSLQILFYLGFNEIILLGVDHDYNLDESQRKKGGVVLSSNNFNHLNIDYYKEEQDVHIDILAMERSYLLAKQAFEKSGRKILNATPGSKLDIFEKVNLLDYVSRKNVLRNNS